VRTHLALATATVTSALLAVPLPPTANADPGALVQTIPAHATAARPAVQRPGTSIVLGQTTFAGLGACTGSPPFGVTLGTSGGGASYTAPSPGVITSWSTVSGGDAGNARLLLFVLGAVANHKTLVGKTDWVPVPSTYGVVHTFPARIPVQTGWEVGLGTSVSGQACAIDPGFTGDVLGAQQVFDADVSTDLTMGSTPDRRPDISAVLESDADRDGYGDVTQDLCPESALTRAACPKPNTKVTKKPKKRSTQRTATFKFTSTVRGSKFTCAVDKKAAKRCTSPFTKRFKYGKHKVVITAISRFGIADPTPAVVRFTVTKPTS